MPNDIVKPKNAFPLNLPYHTLKQIKDQESPRALPEKYAKIWQITVVSKEIYKTKKRSFTRYNAYIFKCFRVFETLFIQISFAKCLLFYERIHCFS